MNRILFDNAISARTKLNILRLVPASYLFAQNGAAFHAAIFLLELLQLLIDLVPQVLIHQAVQQRTEQCVHLLHDGEYNQRRIHISILCGRR